MANAEQRGRKVTIVSSDTEALLPQRTAAHEEMSSHVAPDSA